MDEYSTHLPVLRKVIEVFKPKKIIEHGCGDYSTPLLAQAGELTFTEHDPHWASQVRKSHDLNNAGYFPRDDLVGLDLTGVDMSFVDGKRQGRAPSIQFCMDNKVPVIVFHDSHLDHHYGYDSLVIPEEYHRADFAYTGESRRGTSVLWLGDENVKSWDVPLHTIRDPYYFPTVGWGV
jgi:hypothetical protein